MATARSTTNSDIHSQLNGYVTDYLTKHMYDANTSWPLPWVMPPLLVSRVRWWAVFRPV